MSNSENLLLLSAFETQILQILWLEKIDINQTLENCGVLNCFQPSLTLFESRIFYAVIR